MTKKPGRGLGRGLSALMADVAAGRAVASVAVPMDPAVVADIDRPGDLPSVP